MKKYGQDILHSSLEIIAFWSNLGWTVLDNTVFCHGMAKQDH